jgi:hypothetical protein
MAGLVERASVMRASQRARRARREGALLCALAVAIIALVARMFLQACCI